MPGHYTKALKKKSTYKKPKTGGDTWDHKPQPRPLKNQKDEQENISSEIAKSVGRGTITSKSKGKRRLKKLTWKDEIKSKVRQFKNRKKIKKMRLKRKKSEKT
tara:strand:+ start:1145 stop:1453 length:309 start_codon:yes stop_codon:yes gene_type:complete